jgi:hypothetical protein
LPSKSTVPSMETGWISVEPQPIIKTKINARK